MSEDTYFEHMSWAPLDDDAQNRYRAHRCDD